MPHQQSPEDMKKILERFFLDNGIADLYRYLDVLDIELKKKHQDIAEAINNFKKDHPFKEKTDDQHREIIDLEVEKEQIKGFTNLLRQSFLLSVYSFMELWLVRECFLDSKSNNKEDDYAKAKGTGIDKAKNYFQNSLKSTFPFGSSDSWQWMKNFQLLRDCIIHRQGSLTGFSNFPKNETLVKFVKNEKGLSLYGVENNQIFIEYDFCIKSLQQAYYLMIELLGLPNG